MADKNSVRCRRGVAAAAGAVLVLPVLPWLAPAAVAAVPAGATCDTPGLTSGRSFDAGRVIDVLVAPAAAVGTVSTVVSIPAGATGVTLDVCGAQGANGAGGPGGNGGRVQISDVVGLGGANLTAVAGSRNGRSGGGGEISRTGTAGTGGGYSSVSQGATTLLVAGGGGGGAGTPIQVTTGGNGGASGATATAGGDSPSGLAQGGRPATDSAPGAGGATNAPAAGGLNGKPGAAFLGGNGGNHGGTYSGGGGGGGYFGGGGGAAGGDSTPDAPGAQAGAAGGGGSGYLSSVSRGGTVEMPGVHAGDGVVLISFLPPSGSLILSNQTLTMNAAMTSVTVSGDLTAGTSATVKPTLEPTSGGAAPAPTPASQSFPAGGHYSFTFNISALPQGPFAVRTDANDGGSHSATPLRTTAVKDTQNPALSGQTVSPDPGVGTVVVSGKVVDVSSTTVTVTVAAGTAGGTAPPTQSAVVPAGGGDYAFSFDISGLNTGGYTATANAVDAAGHSSSLATAATKAASGGGGGGGGGTPSPTPTTSASPGSSVSPSSSASPGACAGAAGALPIRVNTPIINATGLASVTVSGARAGQTIVLQGYSQNHFGTASFANDTTPVDRSGLADSNGTRTFNDLRPPSNTRFRARVDGCSFASAFPTALLTVRATLTLRVVRVEKRTYRFSGQGIPARTGGLIVSIYRVIGTACAAGVAPRSCPGEVLISQDRADAVTGKWVRKLVFDKNTPARIRLVLKTGQDSQNAPGRSNMRDVSVF